MELIDRYILEVGKHLPRKNRADIQAELRSLLIDNLEARTGDREPTEDDVVNMLKEFGPPEKVAAEYWPEGQYLIGPKLYPLFRMVVGIALSVFVIVQVVLFGITAVFTPEDLQVFDFISNLFGMLMGAFGSIVFVFAILQRLDVQPDREVEPWDPKDLPVYQDFEPVSRVGILVEITFALFFTALLVLLPGWLETIIPEAQIVTDPVVLRYIPWIILATLLGVGLNVILLWRGRWETWTHLLKIGLNILGIVILSVLLVEQNNWLVAHGVGGFFTVIQNLPDGVVPSLATIEILVMQGLRLAFIIALIVTVIETVKQVYQLIRHLTRRSDPLTIPVKN